MSRKYFVILGLFLVAGFLFLNINSVSAADRYWTGNFQNYGGSATSTGFGASDFWNKNNWDTLVAPSSGDNVWIFATSSPGSTIVISTPVDLGAGNIYLGYNQKGNTAANSAGPVTLLIKEGASLTNTGVFSVGTSSTILLTSGSLNVGSTTIQQLASTTISSVTGATSTVTIAGDFTFGMGALYTSPANSTTTLNLPSGSSGLTTFYATSTPTFGYLVFGGAGGGTTNLQATTTIANRLSIAAGRTLNAGGGTITLSGNNSNSSTFPLEVSGTFTSATSTIAYTGTGTITVASTTYNKVEWNGATTYSLNGATTVSKAGTVASGATLALLTNTLTATGSTWTNNGTVSRTTGKIVLASVSRFDDGSGNAKSAFAGDSRDYVGIQVTDTSLNYDAATAETQTATITAKSMISDTETITLTETAVNSGIFRGKVIMGLSGSDVASQLDFQGPGTLSYTFTDSQDSSDTGTGDTATFTGTAPGGSSSSDATVLATTATSATSAASATPATPATTTPTVSATITATSATSAASATSAVPSLSSVSTKIASVVAKVAKLTKNSPAADIAAVQAEIVAILNDIKAIQAANPAPKGVALGFKFVRPLALGMRNDEVLNLQKALKTDSSIYPEGVASGYFGPATVKAVQKFQAKYGLASSGKPGYGVVGPKTRAKLNELYGNK